MRGFYPGKVLTELHTGGPYRLIKDFPQYGYWRCRDINSGTKFNLEYERVHKSVPYRKTKENV